MSKEIDDLLRQQDDVVVTLFTEEQVREAIDMARSQKGYASYEYTENEIVQSLKQGGDK